MDDRGFFLTRQAIARQLAAMPNELYLIRLIHSQSRRAFPGERLWTTSQLLQCQTIRFLRARNRQGCDIYLCPYAGGRNAGYILVDLDAAHPAAVETMHANGHAPSVVVQTSPGHLQAWIRVSAEPLSPAIATAAGKWLAHTYGGDPASTDWRHLGRLAGFTNQKPARRALDGYAPWVRIVYAHARLAPHADTLLHAATDAGPLHSHLPSRSAAPDHLLCSNRAAADIYSGCMRRWRIRQRFASPDWSIVDLWVARYLLAQGTPAPQVADILRLASPHFPRRHADPEDYLRRTLARASFPAPRGALCDPPKFPQPQLRHRAEPPHV